MIKADMVIKNASQLLTVRENEKDLVGMIQNGCLAMKGEKIVFVGMEKDLNKEVDFKEACVIDARNKVVLPGFVDSHTHVVFGGSRVEEYAIKVHTDDPKELERNNIKTGIMASVDMTRYLNKEELKEQSSNRLKNMLSLGTTTVESKSGYGLSIDSEIKMLQVNKELDEELSIDIISTFLGAHGWPADIDKEKYIDILINEMIPKVSEQKLATFCDVWCDEGHFTAEESEKILLAGRKFGMEAKIHTDAYSYIKGSDLAAQMKMISADHLNYTPKEVLRELANAKVIGVVLPAIDFAVKHPKAFNYIPMQEESLEVAIATNCCPGCYCESMQFVMTLACRNHKMTPQQAIKSATLNGAKALNLRDRGSLEIGKLADIQIWNIDNYKESVYRLGSNVVDKVIKRGKLVYER